MREIAIKNAEYLAKLAVDETRLGRVKDKVQKNLLAAKKTPGTEDLVSKTVTGDFGLTLIEMAPYGVIGAITPITNPSATIINNSISMVAAGNSVVFNPHPGAKGVTNETVKLMNKAIISAGGPKNLVCSIKNPTIETSKYIMKHPEIKLLVVTGGGSVVKAAMTCGKKVIAAGPGNPPVIVDDSANIRKAARDIVDGASFDNNILCTSEKEVFAFENITDELKNEMIRYGAYEIKGPKINDLVNLVFTSLTPKPIVNKKYVGKDASLILRDIDVPVQKDVRLVIVEVTDNHPFVTTEMLMPILPIVRVSNIDEALEKAIIAEKGNKHTAIMHSENIVNMSKVAKNIGTTIFVKNAPSYAGLGMGGEGFTTLSIAGPTGEGLTSARTFTRQRRCVLVGAFRIV
jgi:acyl-CoA reductase-like NAD-dependent aldehyde dehydrogenase